MAENYVQVTEGTGKKLHTVDTAIGGNTVHDEIVKLGEPYLASYTIAPVANISTATVNSHLLQVMAGSSLPVRIRRIEITQSVLATAASFLGLAVYRLTTAGTGGSAYTPSKLDNADNASGATAMTLPTGKGTEGAAVWIGTTILMQTISATPPMNSPIAVIDFERLHGKSLVIPAGTANGIAIKNTVAVAGSSLNFTVWLDEGAV